MATLLRFEHEVPSSKPMDWMLIRVPSSKPMDWLCEQRGVPSSKPMDWLGDTSPFRARGSIFEADGLDVDSSSIFEADGLALRAKRRSIFEADGLAWRHFSVSSTPTTMLLSRKDCDQRLRMRQPGFHLQADGLALLSANSQIEFHLRSRWTGFAISKLAGVEFHLQADGLAWRHRIED